MRKALTLPCSLQGGVEGEGAGTWEERGGPAELAHGGAVT